MAKRQLSPDLYPKFDPQIHLINENHKVINITLKNLNFLSEQCKSYIEPISTDNLINCFPLFTSECITIIKWELNKWLINKDKCENLFSDQNIINFESSSFKNSRTKLPFLCDALENPQTLKLLNNQIGFQLNIITDYEFMHFAKRLSPGSAYKLLDKDILGKSSKIILRKKSVAYPYICIIKLNKSNFSTNLPIGYAFFLKGRLIENLAGKLINKNIKSTNEIILCPSFQPSTISMYENRLYVRKPEKRNKKNVNNNKNGNDNGNETTVDVKDIEKYKKLLNNLYNL